LIACVQAGRTPARRGHDLTVETPDASAFDVASCAASGSLGSRPSSRGFVSLQVWAGGSPGSSAAQRLDPGSPRHRTDAVVVASPYPGAARYASRRRPPPLVDRFLARLAVQRKGVEATHLLAPQRDVGTPPADGELAGARTRRAVAGRPGNSSSTWCARFS
jgi:hypothetical protein